jgi:hypothetical protein
MTLQPYLFCSDRHLVSALCRGAADNVGAVVVDWERDGKPERQAGAVDRIGIDTQINADGPQDLMEVAALAEVPVHCRLNAWKPSSPTELETAIDGGATEVLMPMVRTTAEVIAAIDAARGRVGVGIQVETIEATRIAGQLGELPITRAYVGLMDLALERGAPSIFDAVADGTVERVRACFDVPFGFGGLTVPGGGRPVPTQLLAEEMVRLGCDFTFLRRSFIRDTGHEPGAGLRAIIEMLRELERRTTDQAAADHRALAAFLDDLDREQRHDSVPPGAD